jgi:hypothetical protein
MALFFKRTTPKIGPTLPFYNYILNQPQNKKIKNKLLAFSF